MNNTINTYRFTSDSEPTDEQLAEIMKEVAIEAKQKADAAEKVFNENLQLEIINAIKNIRIKKSIL